MTMPDILPSLKSAPATYLIIGLEWYRDRYTDDKREFLLLEVERPDNNNLWLRLDRRPPEMVTLPQLLTSRVNPEDFVRILLCLNRPCLLKEHSKYLKRWSCVTNPIVCGTSREASARSLLLS